MALRASFPNPVRTQTTIRYALPDEGEVHLGVYDLLGRRVATLADGQIPAGRKQVQLRAEQLSSGTYFLRLATSETVRVQKLTVVR